MSHLCKHAVPGLTAEGGLICMGGGFVGLTSLLQGSMVSLSPATGQHWDV